MARHWMNLYFTLAAVICGVATAQTVDYGDHDESRNVRVGLAADRASVEPGGQLVLAVVLNHAEGFHSQVRRDLLTVDTLIPTSITVRIAGDAAVQGPVQWPEPHGATTDLGDGPVEIPSYDGFARFFVPVLVPVGAPVGSTLSFEVEVEYQSCNAFSCDPPDLAVRTVTVPVSAVGAGGGAITGGDVFAGFDPTTFARTGQWEDERAAQAVAAASGGPGGAEFFGLRLPRADSASGLAVVSLLAVFGGLILNLTPCVLPVIPIKVMTLSQHAGSPGKSLVLGLWMAAGVVAFWVGIGVPVAFVSGFADPSRLFGIWWVTLGIGVLIAVMGVGIMGAFAINLPQQVYMVNPKADTPFGSFAFGIMTAVLGLPCFGFVAGALLAGSAALPWASVLTIFAALGVGMALPYLVLAARPQWVDKIPRTGPASELVKQVMGLLLLAAAAYFIGAAALARIGTESLPWWGKVVHWWVIGVFAIAAGAWLVARTMSITPRAAMRAAMAVIAFVLAGGGVATAANQTVTARNDPWSPFSEAALTSAVEDGEVVVLDFTAEWCLNCKALEATVLLREPVKALLLGDGVLPLKADLTSTDAPGWEKLKSLGQTGIPTLAVFGPGLDRPWISNAYTPDQVVAAIKKARGTGPDR